MKTIYGFALGTFLAAMLMVACGDSDGTILSGPVNSSDSQDETEESSSSLKNSSSSSQIIESSSSANSGFSEASSSSQEASEDEDTEITGCQCNPRTDIVYIQDSSAIVSWAVTGCRSEESAIAGYAWPETIIALDSIGMLRVSSTGSYSSKVSVSNEAGQTVEVECATVKVKSSSSTATSSSSVEIVDDGTVNGTCAPVPATINKGESTTWTFTQVTPAGMAGITAGSAAAYDWSMPSSTEGTANGTGLKTTTATYAESGSYGATLVVDGNTVQCSALQVNGAAITGCSCTADAAEVDIAGASATASWKVTGCTSDATITGFAWSAGVTGSDNTGSMTVSAKGDVTPTVTVSNAEGTKLDVTCATVKVTDSTAPEYEIDGKGIPIPNGGCGKVMVAGALRITHSYVGTDCSVGISIDGTSYPAETVAACNVYYGKLSYDGVNVSVGQEVCVEVGGGATDITLTVQ